MKHDLDRFADADALLGRALDLEPHQRSSFLEDACGDDEELRLLVRRLLVASEAPESILVPGGAMQGPLAQDLCATLVGENPPESADPASAVERLLAGALLPDADRVSFSGVVASGGMGTVEVVIDRALERRMARKVLHANLRNRVQAVSWFVREAQITAQLDHPAIAPIHQIGVDAEGRLHFTMKLVEGETFESLVHRLGDGARDSETTFEILEIVGKVSDALAFAHSRGVIDRDLKPANVMVGDFGEVLV